MANYASEVRKEEYPETVINQYKELINNSEYEFYYFQDENSNQGMSLIHIPKAVMINFYTNMKEGSNDLELEFFTWVFQRLKNQTGNFVSRFEMFSIDIIEHMISLKIQPTIRHYMSINAKIIEEYDLLNFEKPYKLVAWDNKYTNDIAQVVVNSNEGSLDSNISVEFQSVKGTTKLIEDIVNGQHGNFDPLILQVLMDEKEPIGVCFLIYVKHKGFIPQISIAPHKTGIGLGKKLLIHSIKDLIEKRNVEVIDLAVTEKNTAAFEMYQKIGFTTVDKGVTYVYDSTER